MFLPTPSTRFDVTHGRCFCLKVEVLDWQGDRPPRGQYLKALKMSSRETDTSILEAVQTFARLVSFYILSSSFLSPKQSNENMFEL